MPRQPIVVLIHGILSSEKALAPLRAFLEARAYTVLSTTYASRRLTVEDAAAHVHGYITRQIGAHEPFHAVGHSLGGIVLRVMAREHTELVSRERIRHSVMLGTPNQGSKLPELLTRTKIGRRLLGPAGHQITPHAELLTAKLGPVPFSTGIIAGNRSIHPFARIIFDGQPSDGAVTLSATKVPGMSDWIELPVHHSRLHSDPQAMHQVVFFLRLGRFDTSRSP